MKHTEISVGEIIEAAKHEASVAEAERRERMHATLAASQAQIRSIAENIQRNLQDSAVPIASER